MLVTESSLRTLARKIIKELLTKKSGLSMEKMFGGSGGGYGGYGDYDGYDDGFYDGEEYDGAGDDGGDFGESDEKLEEE
jgi:hypothetical protein